MSEGLVQKLNENSFEYMLASDLADIKALLGAKEKTPTIQDDLLLRYPEIVGGTLEASGKFTREIAVNRKLKYLTVSIPTNCKLVIYNNNSVWDGFTDEAGTLEFQNGVSFGVLKLEVTNSDTSNAKAWTCRLIFV